ncbi:MAG: hypothetical protein QOD55_45 [Solirubrobacteraceae bacterium]|jgi:hypothetical protein|nr:hypothetical protein [Solirubrobacteraceae bacterium]MEA2288048.1 hypothetical protein [Solirubrobacteraceae bacterium]
MAISSFADPVTALVRTGRRRAIAVAVALVVLAGAVAAILAATSGEQGAPRFQAVDRSFSVALPEGWRALGDRELRAMPSAPAAVLRREDRRGMIVIQRRAALERSSRSLTRDLTRQLSRRFDGLQPVGARTVPLRSGTGYVYTFARPAAGTVQSIAVAPAGDRTYTMDAVAGAGAPDVAAQIGAIVRSFDIPDPVPSS